MLTQGYEEASELWQNAKKIKNLDEMLKLLAKYL
jgi:tRNA-dihydrouridine synthase C